MRCLMPNTHRRRRRDETEYVANGVSDPLHVWFYARVFGVGGSNGAIYSCTKFKQGRGWETWYFLDLCVTISKTVRERDTTKVTIND